MWLWSCHCFGCYKLCDMMWMPATLPRNYNSPHQSSKGGSLMPIGGNDWLALTPEPTLEPELPICDPHHHLWEFRPEPMHYQRQTPPQPPLRQLGLKMTGFYP